MFFKIGKTTHRCPKQLTGDEYAEECQLPPVVNALGIDFLLYLEQASGTKYSHTHGVFYTCRFFCKPI
jgi:hypothetical protein